MQWIGLLLAVLKISQSLVDYFRGRATLTAAEAQVMSVALKDAIDVINKAQSTADYIRHNPDSDYVRELRERFKRP